MKFAGVLAAVVIATAGQGQSLPDAASLLAKMRAAYGAVKTLHASGEAHFRSFGGRELSVTNSMDFRAPTTFEIETVGVPGTRNSKYHLQTDGKKIHIEGLPGGTVDKPYSYLELMRSLPEVNLEAICFFDWKKQLSTAKDGNMHGSRFEVRRDAWNGKPWIVLREHPSFGQEFIDYYIDPQTDLIWRTAIYDIGQHVPFNDFWLTSLNVKG